MLKVRQLFICSALAMCAVNAAAQSSYEYNSDNSSVYSRYGLGTLAPRANSNTTYMGGAGLAVMQTNRFNPQNPATYAQIDGQTFILDAGMSLDRQTIKYEGAKAGVTGSRLHYVNAGMRLIENLGLSVGYMPVTSIGYDYMSGSSVGWNANTGQEVRTSETFFGTGGLHEVYLGVGYSPIKNLSLGVNAGFIWGEYNHATTQTFTEGGANSSAYNSQTTLYQSNIATYNAQVGLQYGLTLGKKDMLCVGAVVGIGHNTGATGHFYRYTSADTTSIACRKAFDLPMTYSVGLAWQRGPQWKVAVDGELERWGDCRMPVLVPTADGGKDYVSQKGEYLDRWSVRAGVEWCPNTYSRSYLKRVRYQIGGFYNTPYVRVNSCDGPKEYGLTAGFALPVTNGYNNRSTVSVGFEWRHVSPSAPKMITENALSLKIGLTFNEKWFAKWKIM